MQLAMDVSFKPAVSFKCVTKIYLVNSSQTPSEHTCTFSLGKLNSESCFQVEGAGVRTSRVRVRYTPCVFTVATEPVGVDAVQCWYYIKHVIKSHGKGDNSECI